VIGKGFFFFDGDVNILSGIKDFAAFLALNEFDIVLSGDNFDDGMFANGSHWLGSVNGMDFARPHEGCQHPFGWCFGGQNHGQFVVGWWSNVVAWRSFWTYTI
jgi:hypothetical protein